MHGDGEDRMPVAAHGSAKPTLQRGASRRLRYDPLAIAILLGRLDRMRSKLPHPSAEFA